MYIKHEEQYSFKVSESHLDKVHADMMKLLQVLPPNIYDEVLICIHELIINSISEMKVVGQEDMEITIDLTLTDEEALLCLKDLGRGIDKSQFQDRNQDPMREKGRGLDMVMMLCDWFCIYLEDNCYAYYIVKKVDT